MIASSPSIDALSWLDSLHVTDADGALTNRKWPEAQQVRAAFADLIAALERALPTVEHMYHTTSDADGSLWADVIACREALANATGATP